MVVMVSDSLRFKVVARALDRVGAQDAKVVSGAGPFALHFWPRFVVFLEFSVLILAGSPLLAGSPIHAGSPILVLLATGISIMVGGSLAFSMRELTGMGVAGGVLGDPSGNFWEEGLWETGNKGVVADTLHLLLGGGSCKSSSSSSSSKELYFNISK